MKKKIKQTKEGKIKKKKKNKNKKRKRRKKKRKRKKKVVIKLAAFFNKGKQNPFFGG